MSLTRLMSIKIVEWLQTAVLTVHHLATQAVTLALMKTVARKASVIGNAKGKIFFGIYEILLNANKHSPFLAWCRQQIDNVDNCGKLWH